MNTRHPLRLLWSVAVGVALLVHHTASGAHTQTPAPERIVGRVSSAVCDKSIVLLGELPSHGEALAFDAKARIVDQLVATCGFTVVLFEAPIYEFLSVEQAVARNDATQPDLDNAIGRFWLTQELAPWRNALFRAAADRRVTVGGIDDQVSATSLQTRSTLPELVARHSPTASSSLCRQTVGRHLNWTYTDTEPFDQTEQRRLQECADAAAKAVGRSGGADRTDRVMLESFSRYAMRQTQMAGFTRDESMFRNLAWHIDRLPAGSRVVVWTATVHAAKRQGSRPEVPLGTYALQRWGTRVASVGFTAAGGFTSRAGQPPAALAPSSPDSLEATATKDTTWSVLDTAALRAMGRLPSRLFGRVSTEDWADYFDLVVVVREETAPQWLKRP